MTVQTNDERESTARRWFCDAFPCRSTAGEHPDRLATIGRWLAASSVPLTIGFAALAAIVLVDPVGLDAPLLPHAIADEFAHLLTGCIVIIAARAWGAPVSWPAALAGSVAPDIDHIPLLLGWIGAPDGTTRPVTHGLATVIVLLVIAAGSQQWRAVWASAALGVGVHLFRDLGTGAVLLWWPVNADPVSLPYATYIALTAVCVVAGALGAIVRMALSDRALVR